MVAEEDEHHRLLLCSELVDELLQLHVTIHDGRHVVVHGVFALLGVVPGEVVHGAVALGGGIGPVALDVDAEGEVGLAGILVGLEVAVDLRQEDAVLRQIGLGQILIVPLQEAVALKAQIAVEVLAVVEPLVVGMAALHGVALLAEIPDIGVGIAAVVADLVVPGEEAPLAVHSAASKDVGHQVPVVALLLQLVVEGVAAGVQALNIIPGEVHIGLPHEGDDIYLPVLRDIRIGIGSQQLLRRIFRVAFGRSFHHLRNTVDKWVEKTVRDVVLGGGPLVKVLIVFHTGVDILIHVHRRQHAGHR